MRAQRRPLLGLAALAVAIPATAELTPFKELRKANDVVEETFKGRTFQDAHDALRRAEDALEEVRGTLDRLSHALERKEVRDIPSVPDPGFRAADLDHKVVDSLVADLRKLATQVGELDATLLDVQAEGFDTTSEKAVLLQVLDYSLLQRVVELHANDCAGASPACDCEAGCAATEPDLPVHRELHGLVPVLAAWVDDVLVTRGYVGAGGGGLQVANFSERVAEIVGQLPAEDLVLRKSDVYRYEKYDRLVKDNPAAGEMLAALPKNESKQLDKSFASVSSLLSDEEIEDRPVEPEPGLTSEDVAEDWRDGMLAALAQLRSDVNEAGEAFAADEADRRKERLTVVALLHRVAFERAMHLYADSELLGCSVPFDDCSCYPSGGSTSEAILRELDELACATRPWLDDGIAWLEAEVGDTYDGPPGAGMIAENYADRVGRLIEFGVVHGEPIIDP